MGGLVGGEVRGWFGLGVGVSRGLLDVVGGWFESIWGGGRVMMPSSPDKAAGRHIFQIRKITKH